MAITEVALLEKYNQQVDLKPDLDFLRCPGTVILTRYDLWLGRQDSNLGMAASKAAALPLGDAPTWVFP
jgi:hypothetical protein